MQGLLNKFVIKKTAKSTHVNGDRAVVMLSPHETRRGAETLHENDHKLAGYLSLSSTSALRDLGNKPETVALVASWQQAQISGFGVQKKSKQTVYPPGPIFSALSAHDAT